MSSYDDSLRRTRAVLKRELLLGRGKHTGRLHYLTRDEYELTHLHVIGAPGFGKSFYTEHLLRSFIELPVPASLIDPHGDQAQNFYQCLIRIPRLVRERKILRFVPGASTNALGFNPFHCNLPEPAEVASLVLEAFMKVWGQATFNETPRLERILRAMFHMFAVGNVPLTQAYQFLLVGNRAYREQLLSAVQDKQMRENWTQIEELPKSDKIEHFESSWNRLQRFLSLPAVAELFEANGRGLRFPEMLDKGEVLVADLSRLRTREAQSLVGTMMVNSLYYAAKHLPKSRRRPRVVAIDEFPQFVTATVASSLDELRKFGVHLILAHQHLSQLTPELRGALMGDAKIKCVFGGLSREDAEILVRELFTGEVRGDRIKRRNWSTKFRPYLTERTVESYSESSTDSASRSEGRSDGGTWGESSGSSSSDTDDTVTHALSSGSSSGFSSSNGSSHSGTTGHSHSSQFVTEHEEFQEESAPVYWTLEEQWEKLIARLMKMDRREAIIKVPNRDAIDILTPEVRKLPVLPSRRPKPKPPGPSGPPTPDSGADSDRLPEDFRE